MQQDTESVAGTGQVTTHVYARPHRDRLRLGRGEIVGPANLLESVYRSPAIRTPGSPVGAPEQRSSMNRAPRRRSPSSGSPRTTLRSRAQIAPRGNAKPLSQGGSSASATRTSRIASCTSSERAWRQLPAGWWRDPTPPRREPARRDRDVHAARSSAPENQWPNHPPAPELPSGSPPDETRLPQPRQRTLLSLPE